MARTHNRSMSTALMIAIAIIAVAIPTCQMVGCNTGTSSGTMCARAYSGSSVGGACGGT